MTEAVTFAATLRRARLAFSVMTIRRVMAGPRAGRRRRPPVPAQNPNPRTFGVTVVWR